MISEKNNMHVCSILFFSYDESRALEMRSVNGDLVPKEQFMEFENCSATYLFFFKVWLRSQLLRSKNPMFTQFI